MVMIEVSSSEFIFYGGIAIMAVVCILTVVCIAVFTITGIRLKKRLEQEYGKPRI